MSKANAPWPFTSHSDELQRAAASASTAADPPVRRCDGCRYWSDLIAYKPPGTWDLMAMCLNAASDAHQNYTPARGRCSGWAINDLGAVDEPDKDPRRYIIRGG